MRATRRTQAQLPRVLQIVFGLVIILRPVQLIQRLLHSQRHTNRENLLDSIHGAAKGETLLKPEILARLLAAQSKPVSNSVAQVDSMLTERELEVLQAASRGERNKEIAYKLGITERTVKAHLASIYQNFNVDSRAAAVAIAAQRGLLKE